MTHRHTAYFQAALTLVFFVGYFFTLRDFLHGDIKVSIDWKETIQNLLVVLTTGVLLILNYWFQRQRTSTDPTKPETP